jgi:short-subunit dehydrogenase
VTGASSGLGREAAAQLAERGCRVVLAARRQAALEEVAHTCRERGGQALVVPTDVTQEAEVGHLLEAALQEWRRVDAWVNNAGVTAFGLLDETPLAPHRRVIEVNLFGALYGARAVLPLFRRQRRGVLVNVGSILGKIGQAFVPSYVISKFALRGLTEALRAEVADEPGIHVCSFLPYAVDTPHFQSGANRTGRAAHAMQPVQGPERVARELVRLVEHPRRERHVPRYTRLGLALHELRPRAAERVLARALDRFHFDEPQPDTDGNLWRPLAEPASVRGTRPPRVGPAYFFAWSAREWIRVELDGLRERLWPTRATTP